MAKKGIFVSVDIDIWQLAKTKGINISEICNFALKYAVNGDNSKQDNKEELQAALAGTFAKYTELKRKLSVMESAEAFEECKKEEDNLKEKMELYKAKRIQGFETPIVQEDD